MTPPPDNKDILLEARLRRDCPPLPDAGFANRVLAALPPPKPALRARSRLAFGAAGALAGVVVAVAANRASSGPTTDLETVAAAFAQTLSPFADPMTLLALSVAGCSLVYAFWAGALRGE